ncbi:MAG: hypothetical protein C4523_14180 [Myxococcales bacterium]|nr:MAG: hypothetical protein C4523_14180 [Myxococcales bacterium]
MILRLKVLIAITFILLAFSAAGPTANASEIEQPGRFGLGLSVGWPGPALSTNTFVADWMSIQANLGPFWSFHGGFLAADYLFWLHDIVTHEKLDFTWFVGPGLVFAFWDNRYSWRRNASLVGAVEGDIGLALQFKEQPFDLVFQVAPGVMFGEFGAWLWIQGNAAFRYYF